MTISSDFPRPALVLGYDLDAWNQHGERRKITVDLSPENNSHMLLCGMSGSGKSYLENAVLAKLALSEPNGEIHFADYKLICEDATAITPTKTLCKPWRLYITVCLLDSPDRIAAHIL